MEFVNPHQILDELLVQDLKFDDKDFTEALLVQNYRDRNIFYGRDSIQKSLQNSGLGQKGRSQAEWEKFGVNWIDTQLKKRYDNIQTVIAKNLTVGALNRAKLANPYDSQLDTIPVIDLYFYIQFNTMVLGNVKYWGNDEIDWCDLEMQSQINSCEKGIKTFSLQKKSQLFTREIECNIFEQMKLTGFNKDELENDQSIKIDGDKVYIDPKRVRQFFEEWEFSIQQKLNTNYEINDKQRDPDNKTSVMLEALINFKK